MGRPHWTNVSIHLGDGTALDGPLRLAALFLFLRDETSPQVVVRGPDGSIVTEPLTVGWANFPLQEAIEAATAHRHELAKCGAWRR